MRKMKLFAAIGAFAALAAGTSPGLAATVNLLRGGTSEVVSLAPPAAGTVNVLRGIPAAAATETRQPRPSARPQPATYIVGGGDTLWLVERETGALVACFVGGSSVAGQSRIRCARQTAN